MKTNSKVIALSIFIISCSNLKNENENMETGQGQTFEISSDIQRNVNLKKMLFEKEFSILFDSTTLQTKTNNIIFLADEKIDLKDTLDIPNNSFAKNRICSANYWKSDTLKINVINSDGYTGNGFSISVFKNKYKIKYTSFSDAGPSSFNSPDLKFSFSRLILNGENYKKNDSIYGFVEFKCVDEKTFSKPFEYYAKGYFRAKIQDYQ